jgi:hypothetical protein
MPIQLFGAHWLSNDVYLRPISLQSKADIAARPNVRFTSQSGHRLAPSVKKF